VIMYRVEDRRRKACVRREGGKKRGKDSCMGGYRNEKPFFLWTFINLMLDFIVTMWNRGAKSICDILATVDRAFMLFIYSVPHIFR
jgi:hypothetical protein